MKRRGTVLLVAVMAFLILILGSCSAVSTAPPGVSVIHQASASSVLSGGRAGHDSTDFLVGEFTSTEYFLVRFNGRGEITLIGENGESQVGLYSMTEYEAQEAEVAINLNGVTSRYSYQLLSGSGDFSLTDASGNVYVFSPVQYN